MAQQNGNKQRGWVNYFRVLAGGYLLYLAYRLMRGIWDGTAEQAALNAVAGVVFGRFNAARLMPVVTSLFVFSALGLFGCYHFSFIPGFALAILLVGLTAGGVVVASLRLLIMDTSLTERSGVIAAIYLGGYIGSGTPNLIIGMLPAVSMDGISLGYSVWVLVSFAIVIFMLRKINRQPTAAEKLRFKRERPLLK